MTISAGYGFLFPTQTPFPSSWLVQIRYTKWWPNGVQKTFWGKGRGIHTGGQDTRTVDDYKCWLWFLLPPQTLFSHHKHLFSPSWLVQLDTLKWLMNWAQEDISFLSSQAWLPNPAETFSSGAKWSGREACQHNTTAWDKGSKEKMGTWASSHSTSRQDVLCGQGMPDPYRVTTLGMIKPTFHSCWWFGQGLSLPALSLYVMSSPFLGVHHITSQAI